MQETTFKEFHKKALRLLNLLNALTEEQINFQPEQSWSAAQFGDHLLKSYAFVRTLNGETRKTERPIDQKLKPVELIFADDSIKMDAPKAIVPTNEKINKVEVISGLEKKVAKTEKVIQTKDLSLTCVDFSILEYGEFTRLEWIWFNIYHRRRHIRQLENMLSANNRKKMKACEIIQAYFSCYEKSDRDALENLIDDRIEFSSPHDEQLDKVTYFEKCWGFNKKVERYEVLKFVENNDEAFISYRAITYDNHQFENAEYFQIQEAKIIKIRVYYGNLRDK